MDKQLQPQTDLIEVEQAVGAAASSKAAAAESCILQSIEDAAFFTCTSGELLWGQVHTVIEGSTATWLDTADGPQDTFDPLKHGGTIVQNNFRYKVAARKGRWKAAAAFEDSFVDDKPRHIGYVCHHIDTDGLEILRRASEAQTNVRSPTAKFGDDLGIVYVNRYDWSYRHNYPSVELILQAVEGKEFDPEKYSEDEYYWQLVHRRFLLLDAQGFPNLLQALTEGCRLERENYVMRYNYDGTDGNNSCSDSSTCLAVDEEKRPSGNSEDGGAFGIHLVVEDTEYELGWMAFRNGELVGFVYDGAYSSLQGNNLRLGRYPVRV